MAARAAAKTVVRRGGLVLVEAAFLLLFVLALLPAFAQGAAAARAVAADLDDDDSGDADTARPRGPMTTLPAYDEAVARYLAEMNAAAYACGSYEGCGQWACTSCLRHPNVEVIRFQNDQTSTSGFVGYDPDEGRIVVAYAGTQPGDIQAWIGNVNGELVDYPKCADCQVHAGFDSDYKSTAPHMKEALAYVMSKFPTAPLWITGHSLGGALAMLAATDLHSNHSIHATGIYTFGQPRVGNQAFAYHFKEITTKTNTPYYRVVHAQDPVVHVPPVLLGFWHAPFEVFYNKDESEYRVCDATGEDISCSNSYLFQFDVADHQEYLGVLF